MNCSVTLGKTSQRFAILYERSRTDLNSAERFITKLSKINFPDSFSFPKRVRDCVELSAVRQAFRRLFFETFFSRRGVRPEGVSVSARRKDSGGVRRAQPLHDSFFKKVFADSSFHLHASFIPRVLRTFPMKPSGGQSSDPLGLRQKPCFSSLLRLPTDRNLRRVRSVTATLQRATKLSLAVG